MADHEVALEIVSRRPATRPAIEQDLEPFTVRQTRYRGRYRVWVPASDRAAARLLVEAALDRACPGWRESAYITDLP